MRNQLYHMETIPKSVVPAPRRGFTSPARQAAAWMLGLAIAWGGAGCRPSDSPATRQPSITARPNPVPPSNGAGTAAIHWDTGDGTAGEVHVVVDDGEEKLVAELPDGSVTVDWIQPGSHYEFKLYAAPGRSRLLGSVKVAMGKPTGR